MAIFQWFKNKMSKTEDEHLKKLLDAYILEKIIFLKPKGKRGEIEEIFEDMIVYS